MDIIKLACQLWMLSILGVLGFAGVIATVYGLIFSREFRAAVVLVLFLTLTMAAATYLDTHR